MLIRKNTKAFKTILQLVTTCHDRPEREQLIRLYITKAGDSIKDRIAIDAIEGNATLFYEMTYQAVLSNLKSSNHQLQVSDEVSGLYYFHSSSNKVWDETPFEFDQSIKKEFASLPELPLVRKKESTGKFSLPTPATKPRTAPQKKEKKKIAKTAKPVHKEPEQPKFDLRHPIEFTNLDRLVYRQARVDKKRLLQYYSDISEYLLPHLKDRPLLTRFQADSPRASIELTPKALFNDNAGDMPRWIKTASGEGTEKKHLLICNDREHLLFLVEHGCIEFIPWIARTKAMDSPDYVLIAIESSDADFTRTVHVAQAAYEVFKGLQLPAYAKTDGGSGLHVYLPLNSGSDFQASREVAKLICKLIRLKIPDVVVLKSSGTGSFGKVILDHTLNQEANGVIAPYSLLAGPGPIVATPLLWEEIEDGLRPEDFHHESILTRIKKNGDPFEGMFRKKLNADDLLKRLQENYSFLF